MQLLKSTNEESLLIISLQVAQYIKQSKNSTKDKLQTNFHAIDIYFQIKHEQIKSSNLFKNKTTTLTNMVQPRNAWIV